MGIQPVVKERVATRQTSGPARRFFWRRLARHRLALCAGITLALLCAVALSAPYIAPHDHTEVSYAGARPPSSSHWLGTDQLGRDQLSRLMHGARVSLAIGIFVALLSCVLGTAVGLISGYYRGALDTTLMRFTDLMMCLPALPLLMVAAAFFGGSLATTVLILGVLMWMPVARVVRACVLSLREKEFIEAARAMGASGWRILTRHILPNTLGPIVVSATLAVGNAILAESVLSFLGFGIQPPTPTWGNMLSDARSTMFYYPWLAWFPGVLIVITVLAVNFLGDGLRDAFDTADPTFAGRDRL